MIAVLALFLFSCVSAHYDNGLLVCPDYDVDRFADATNDFVNCYTDAYKNDEQGEFCNCLNNFFDHLGGVSCLSQAHDFTHDYGSDNFVSEFNDLVDGDLGDNVFDFFTAEFAADNDAANLDYVLNVTNYYEVFGVHSVGDNDDWAAGCASDLWPWNQYLQSVQYELQSIFDGKSGGLAHGYLLSAAFDSVEDNRIHVRVDWKDNVADEDKDTFVNNGLTYWCWAVAQSLPSSPYTEGTVACYASWDDDIVTFAFGNVDAVLRSPASANFDVLLTLPYEQTCETSLVVTLVVDVLTTLSSSNSVTNCTNGEADESRKRHEGYSHVFVTGDLKTTDSDNLLNFYAGVESPVTQYNWVVDHAFIYVDDEDWLNDMKTDGSAALTSAVWLVVLCLSFLFL